MSLTSALAFADRIIADEAYRRRVIAKIPPGAVYESGKEQVLYDAIAVVAKAEGYDITPAEVAEAVDIKSKELGKLKSIGLARKLKKEFDSRPGAKAAKKAKRA